MVPLAVGVLGGVGKWIEWILRRNNGDAYVPPPPGVAAAPDAAVKAPWHGVVAAWLMRTEHRSDGVTTYVYGPDDHEALTVLDIRNAVERIESMCRDILTVLQLLIELLPEAHGSEQKRRRHGDPYLQRHDTVAGDNESCK